MPSDSISPLVEQIYDAAIDERPWENVLEALARLFHANSAAITIESKRGGGWGVSFGAADRSFHDSYFAHYSGINPFSPHTFAIPAGTVLTDRMIMRMADYRRTEFFNDWARPQGFDNIVHLRIENSGDTVIGVGLTRSRGSGEFESDEIALQQFLLPHLRRGIRTSLRLAEAKASGLAMGEALDQLRRGVIGLDAACRVVFANQAAQSSFARGDMLQVSAGVLTAVRSNWTSDLRRIVDSAIRGRTSGSLILPRPDGRPGLLLEAVPAAGSVALLGLHSLPVALLIITDPEDDVSSATEPLRALYGLTAKEAEVAVHAARGEGLATVAATLGMARSTAQSHLKKVFDKTQTHRQAELAWLVARLSG